MKLLAFRAARLAALGITAGLWAFQGQAAFGQTAVEPAQHTMEWGKLTVREIPPPEGAGPGAKCHVQVLDKAGKILVDLSDVFASDTALYELTGGGVEELEVNMYSGGAHCCYTNYVFTQDGGFRQLIDLPGGQICGIDAVKNIDGKGRPEIIVNDINTWAYFGGLAYAFSPAMPLIIGWNGKNYVNQTARFPQRSLDKARAYQRDLLSARRKDLGKDQDIRPELCNAAALGYLANMLAIGKGKEADAWLRKNASKDTLAWLAENRTDIRRTMAKWSKADYTPNP
jgi:hypothetical protein